MVSIILFLQNYEEEKVSSKQHEYQQRQQQYYLQQNFISFSFFFNEICKKLLLYDGVY